MNIPLESAPTDDQKHRLQDWLTELNIICRRYRLVLDTDDGETRLIDIDTATTIGIGVSYQLDERNGRTVVASYDCTGSILDGVWLIDSPEGVREQRDLGPVFPAPHTSEDT